MLDGVVKVTAGSETVTLHADDFAYVPAHMEHVVTSASGAGLLLFERRYAVNGRPRFIHGHTQEQQLLPTAGEVFALRKLLPQTADYDFNVHVMDFLPGEHLNVKEVHYNQHGLLLLQGKGIYRWLRAGGLAVGGLFAYCNVQPRLRALMLILGCFCV